MVTSLIPTVSRVRNVPRKTNVPAGFISVDDAAALAGIGRTTAYRYARPGDLWEAEGVRIYRPTKSARWVHRADLVTWIRNRGGIVPEEN